MIQSHPRPSGDIAQGIRCLQSGGRRLKDIRCTLLMKRQMERFAAAGRGIPDRCGLREREEKEKGYIMISKSAKKRGAQSLDSMEDLLKEELQDLYDMESAVSKALPKMEKAVSAEELKLAFRQHIDTTKRQKIRLEEIFSMLNMKPAAKECDGIRGIISEGESLISAKGNACVKDAALIAAAQRAEHYEMASYGCARSFAQQLGRSDVADLLQQTLNEEGSTDHRLTCLAEGGINQRAMEC
jgi:ferritin-like metal-binding protein YciE